MLLKCASSSFVIKFLQIYCRIVESAAVTDKRKIGWLNEKVAWSKVRNFGGMVLRAARGLVLGRSGLRSVVSLNLFVRMKLACEVGWLLRAERFAWTLRLSVARAFRRVLAFCRDASVGNSR